MILRIGMFSVISPRCVELILGESYTTGETFNSVSIRGIRLYSDSRMLPPTLASFAPIIHGVANTNAKVTITQGGYKIYETTVPPGAFVIDDLSPSGYGSDLIVTIEESDGSSGHSRNLSHPLFKCYALASDVGILAAVRS